MTRRLLLALLPLVLLGVLLPLFGLSLLAVLTGSPHSPNAEQATLWLYGEALPSGRITADQAAGIVRTLTLAQAAAVPEALLRQSFDETRALLAATPPGS